MLEIVIPGVEKAAADFLNGIIPQVKKENTSSNPAPMAVR